MRYVRDSLIEESILGDESVDSDYSMISEDSPYPAQARTFEAVSPRGTLPPRPQVNRWYSPRKAPSHRVRTRTQRVRDRKRRNLEFDFQLLEQRQHWRSLEFDKVIARKELAALDDQSKDEKGGNAEVTQDWEARYGPGQRVGEDLGEGKGAQW